MYAKLKTLDTMDENIKIILDVSAYKKDCKNDRIEKPEDIKPKDSLPSNDVPFWKQKSLLKLLNFNSAANLWPSYPWKNAFSKLLKSFNSSVEHLKKNL